MASGMECTTYRSWQQWGASEVMGLILPSIGTGIKARVLQDFYYPGHDGQPAYSIKEGDIIWLEPGSYSENLALYREDGTKLSNSWCSKFDSEGLYWERA